MGMARSMDVKRRKVGILFRLHLGGDEARNKKTTFESDERLLGDREKGRNGTLGGPNPLGKAKQADEACLGTKL